MIYKEEIKSRLRLLHNEMGKNSYQIVWESKSMYVTQDIIITWINVINNGGVKDIQYVMNTANQLYRKVKNQIQ